MKISGYVCVRNMFKLDYCADLTVNSLLPVCDEVLVSIGIKDGEVDDGTYAYFTDWITREPKLRFHLYEWPDPHRDITWWTTWINEARSQLIYPMQMHLDADEILDPLSYPAILKGAEGQNALWFQRLNFWRDAQHLAPSGHVCADQVVRFGPTDLWMPSDEPHPEGEPEIRVRAGWPPNADRSQRIFHYGFLRKQQAMIEKCRVVNGAFFGTMDDRLVAAEKDGLPWVDKIEMAAPLQDFFEPHPDLAQDWLRERGSIPFGGSGRYTAKRVAELGKTDFFELSTAAACIAILPFVKPEHTGVEIGVYKGDSSDLFLKHCSRMHFIDPCVEYEGNPDKGWFTIENRFLKRMEPYSDRFKFIKGFSADVSDQIPEVDFIFIDANHEYAYVKQDIELYWPKVRQGGFISGHDYSGGHPGVTQAVDEFFGKLGLPVEHHQYCWKVNKP